MSDQFVGEVRPFAFNFAPKGWAFCDGQLLPLSQNTALFSLLGTFYGGDGKSTFALPNLQGRLANCQGQLAGGNDYFIGDSAGSENVTLLSTEMPDHTHTLRAAIAPPAASATPAAGALGFKPNVTNIYSSATSPLGQFSPNALGPAGSNLPHNNMMPYLTLNFCIALQGIFPARG